MPSHQAEPISGRNHHGYDTDSRFSERTTTQPEHDTFNTSDKPQPSTETTSTRPHGYPRPLPAGRGFPVLCRRLLSTTPTTLLLTRTTSTTYKIATTAETPLFYTTSRQTLLHDVRTLHEVDASRERVHVRRLRATGLSARGGVVFADGGGRDLMTMRRSAAFGVRGWGVHGVLDGGVRFVVRKKGKGFVVTDWRCSEVVAVERVGGKDGALRAFVAPGYDVALFGMVCVVVLEMF